MLAVTSGALLTGSLKDLNVQPPVAVTASAASADRAVVNALMTEISGIGMPAAPIAPLLSLLTIMPTTLGSGCAASNRSNESPPIIFVSLWQTAQYFCTSAFCWVTGIAGVACSAQAGI